jgi:uncharacterized protein YjbI with pentapeptide repeats
MAEMTKKQKITKEVKEKLLTLLLQFSEYDENDKKAFEQLLEGNKGLIEEIKIEVFEKDLQEKNQNQALTITGSHLKFDFKFYLQPPLINADNDIAEFHKTIFSQDVEFCKLQSKVVNFSQSTFVQKATFSLGDFSNPNFEETSFNQETYFNFKSHKQGRKDGACVFNGGNFSNSSFGKMVDFSYNKFNGKINFSYANFENAVFDKIKFGRGSSFNLSNASF